MNKPSREVLEAMAKAVFGCVYDVASDGMKKHLRGQLLSAYNIAIQSTTQPEKPLNPVFRPEVGDVYYGLELTAVRRWVSALQAAKPVFRTESAALQFGEAMQTLLELQEREGISIYSKYGGYLITIDDETAESIGHNKINKMMDVIGGKYEG